jgi:hypothetical protein
MPKQTNVVDAQFAIGGVVHLTLNVNGVPASEPHSVGIEEGNGISDL